jgi:hypothetical protein
VLADLDLSGTKPPLVNESTEITIDTPGLLGGLLGYFDLDVAPGERISTSPSEAGETCNWAVKIWTFGSQVTVKRGDRIKVSYRYRVDSSATRVDLVLQTNEAS